MNVNEFKNKIKANRPLLDNRYEILFTPPQILQSTYSKENLETISAYGRNLNAFGRNIMTSDVRQGRSFQLPYANQYNTTNFTVMLDKKYVTKNFFDDWQDSIMHPSKPILKSFYKQYVTDVIINHFNEFGEISQSIRLVDAFPSIVGDVNFASDGSNNIAIISITISFRYWERISQGQ